MSRQHKKTTTEVPRELAFARLRSWQSVRTEALKQLANTLKSARLATGRKQRQVQAVAQQPGQEYMAETTISRAEKAQVLSQSGDIGLMKVAYLALLYGLDVSSVVRRMFAPLERHAQALDDVQSMAQLLSDSRMAKVVEYTRQIAVEQAEEDEEIGAGQWVNTAYAYLDDVRSYRGETPAEPTNIRAVDAK